jgi:hypothetical protein
MKTFVRNKFIDVARMLSISTPRMIKVLKDNGVILNTNGRNLPTRIFIQRGWFIVDYIEIHEKDFKAIVPTVDVTEIGFKEIERLINDSLFTEVKFVHLYNQINMELCDFILERTYPRSWEIMKVETQNYINIILQKPKNFELILKYDKNQNRLWRTK